ncbi:MAG TPA: hypothetical protein V6C81_15440 [Planktothrix sp.]|jgi:hypothetical protein
MVNYCELQENKVSESQNSNSGAEEQMNYIGIAWISEDGTIRMKVRMPIGAGSGQSSLTYTVDDPNYQKVLAHIGPIKPGEVVSVKPFE